MQADGRGDVQVTDQWQLSPPEVLCSGSCLTLWYTNASLGSGNMEAPTAKETAYIACEVFEYERDGILMCRVWCKDWKQRSATF